VTDPTYDVVSDSIQIFNSVCTEQDDPDLVEVKAYLLAKQHWITRMTVERGERPSDEYLHRLASDTWKSFTVAVDNADDQGLERVEKMAKRNMREEIRSLKKYVEILENSIRVRELIISMLLVDRGLESFTFSREIVDEFLKQKRSIKLEATEEKITIMIREDV